MKFLTTFLKDLKLSFRTFYIYIEIALAVIFILVMLFVLPENFTTEHDIYTLIELEEPAYSSVRTLFDEGAEADRLIYLDSREAIEIALLEDREAAGIHVFRSAEGRITYDFVLQGYESPKLVELLKQTFVGDLTTYMPDYEDQVSITTLGGAREKLSDRLTVLPVFLVLNSAFTGLFIVAAYIFMDKDEGTIKALTVTPAKISDYLLAKLGMMLVMGMLTSLLVTLAIARGSAHYGPLMIFMAAANLFGTAIGLLLTSFYDDLMKAMSSIFVVVFVLAFSTISYFMPSFSPLIIRMIPTYPMLVSIRELLYRQPNLTYVYVTAGGLLAGAAVIFMLALYRFKKTLTV